MNNFNNFNGTNFNPISEYPYGELPLKYTKQGQSKLREELKNRNYVTNVNEFNNVNTESYNNNANNQNNLVNTLNNNNNNSLDISTLLPLLIGLNGNNSNMEAFNKLLPLLSGNSKPDMQTMLKMFSEFNKKSSNVSAASKPTSDNNIVIDNLKKVD